MVPRRSSLVAVLVLAAVAAAPALTTSCTSTYYPPLCESYVTRCRTVCDPWCDDFGCYTDCRDDCWEECTGNPSPPGERGPIAEAGVPEASPMLCRPCQSNDDCGATGSGALCVRQGGDGGGAGFCGQACRGRDCPAGYECSEIGSSRQCVPASGSCTPTPL